MQLSCLVQGCLGRCTIMTGLHVLVHLADMEVAQNVLLFVCASVCLLSVMEYDGSCQCIQDSARSELVQVFAGYGTLKDTHPAQLRALTYASVLCCGEMAISPLAVCTQDIGTHVIVPLAELAKDPLSGAIPLVSAVEAAKGSVAMPAVST